MARGREASSIWSLPINACSQPQTQVGRKEPTWPFPPGVSLGIQVIWKSLSFRYTHRHRAFQNGPLGGFTIRNLPQRCWSHLGRPRVPLCFPNLETGEWRRLTQHTGYVLVCATSVIFPHNSHWCRSRTCAHFHIRTLRKASQQWSYHPAYLRGQLTCFSLLQSTQKAAPTT